MLAKGNYVYIWEWEDRTPFGLQRNITYTYAKLVEITKIQCTDTPGKVTITVDDGSQLGRRFDMARNELVPQQVMDMAD